MQISDGQISNQIYSNLSRNGLKSFNQISNPHFSSNPTSFKVKSQIFYKNKYQDIFNRKSRSRCLTQYILSVIAHDIFGRVTVFTMSVIIIQWCNSGIKLHSKQKCFDDSCIAVCIGKHAADLSRFKFCFKSNCKKIPMKSQIE